MSHRVFSAISEAKEDLSFLLSIKASALTSFNSPMTLWPFIYSCYRKRGFHGSSSLEAVFYAVSVLLYFSVLIFHRMFAKLCSRVSSCFQDVFTPLECLIMALTGDLLKSVPCFYFPNNWMICGKMKLRIGMLMGALRHRGQTLEFTLYPQFWRSKVKFSWTLLQNCIKNVNKIRCQNSRQVWRRGGRRERGREGEKSGRVYYCININADGQGAPSCN